MPKNTLADLRNHLFETIEALKDEEKPMDLNRAKVISDVAQVLINSAKVEVDLVKAIDGARPATGSFFGVPDERQLIAEAREAGKQRRISG